MKGKRGGTRPGAGRPAKAKPVVPVPTVEIDWAQVERFANVGADESVIVTGLGITDEQLKDPEVSQRLRMLVNRGNAVKKLMLQEAIDKLGKGEGRGGGNTLALEARNRLDWDRQLVGQEPPPDVSLAHARLRLTLERLAKAKGEELGRTVEPAEILIAEVFDKDGARMVH